MAKKPKTTRKSASSRGKKVARKAARSRKAARGTRRAARPAMRMKEINLKPLHESLAALQSGLRSRGESGAQDAMDQITATMAAIERQCAPVMIITVPDI